MSNMTQTKPKGSGPITCECGQHRSRCDFGQPHVWIFRIGPPNLRDTDEADCARCGAYCAGRA